jgi:hypothetical protein
LTTTAAQRPPPLAGRVTKSLLGYGVIAGPIYVVVVGAQAITREGFDPTRHAASRLANGDLGWIQIANFAVTGAMTIAAATGVRRALGYGRLSAWASGLIGGYGAGLLAAGAFRADPSLGFPPGTRDRTAEMSWHGMAHFVSAGLGFACLIAACFVLAGWFARTGQRGWAWYSRITAILFAAGFAAISSGSGGPAAMLLFTAAIVLGWVWLSAVSVRLYRSVGPSACC